VFFPSPTPPPGAAGKEPGRWRRCIILNIPPFAIFSENIVTYDQIKRSFYFGTSRCSGCART